MPIEQGWELQTCEGLASSSSLVGLCARVGKVTELCSGLCSLVLDRLRNRAFALLAIRVGFGNGELLNWLSATMLKKIRV